ncbi:MAG: glycosyl transferase, partial [Lentisphaeria bacterium]|nr:glycosyl transferase [Lentisphaeria bacterium]
MQAKADLHIHSKYSDRPSEWILRRIGAPECFVEPREIYRQARRNGMTFVTITDHNSISGCLEIADLPGTFLSTEVTTYFPEDRCKIHVLVYGVTEAQFADIETVRENIREFRDYLNQHGIAHSVAHPFFAVNERLKLRHVEQLLLLFNRFESLNGTRYLETNRMLAVLLDSLTPEVIAELADAHGIVPCGKTPWIKYRTGGSDDHSGIYVASAHTVTPMANSVQEFLQHLQAGRHQPGGEAGTSIQLAHSFYRIAYSYYRQRLTRNGRHSALFSSLLQRMAGEASGSPPAGPVRRLANRVLTPWKTRRLSAQEQSLIAEMSALFSHVSSE